MSDEVNEAQGQIDQGIANVSTPALDSTQTQDVTHELDKPKKRLKSYAMDLRIHSPASLGYLAIEGIDTAPALVRLARVKGLDIIGVTDFISGVFLDRVQSAAQGTGVTIIPGMVLRTAVGSCDDVILSCLFPEHFSTASIEGVLDALEVPRAMFGNRTYLHRKSLESTLEVIEGQGGICIPTRMDKTPHRLAVVPTLVDQFGFKAFDLAYADSNRFFKSRWPKQKFALFSFSNAHALAQVGSRFARVKMSEAGFAGIRSLTARASTST